MTGNPENVSATIVPTRLERILMAIALLVLRFATMAYLYQWAFAPAIEEILEVPSDSIALRVLPVLVLAMVAVFGAIQVFDCAGWFVRCVAECLVARRVRDGRQG